MNFATELAKSTFPKPCTVAVHLSSRAHCTRKNPNDKKEQKQSIQEPKNEWILDRIETEIPNLIGARYYKWVD